MMPKQNCPFCSSRTRDTSNRWKLESAQKVIAAAQTTIDEANARIAELESLLTGWLNRPNGFTADGCEQQAKLRKDTLDKLAMKFEEE